jgi:hypothetical protein
LCARVSAAICSVLSRVYSRFEPGGVSTMMLSSALSSSGKKLTPTSALWPMVIIGMASAKKNVAAASIDTFHLWSSAQPMTPR